MSRPDGGLNAQAKPDYFAGGGNHAASAVFGVGTGRHGRVTVIDDAFAIAGMQVILPKIGFRAPALRPEAHDLLSFGTDIGNFQSIGIGAPEKGAGQLGHHAAAVLGVGAGLSGLAEQGVILD